MLGVLLSSLYTLHTFSRTYLTHGQVGMAIDQYNANADLHVPPASASNPAGFTKYSNEPIVEAPHINGYVLFFNNGDDVRYKVGTAKQICHRDRGLNVVCNFMYRPWDKE